MKLFSVLLFLAFWASPAPAQVLNGPTGCPTTATLSCPLGPLPSGQMASFDVTIPAPDNSGVLLLLGFGTDTAFVPFFLPLPFDMGAFSIQLQGCMLVSSGQLVLFTPSRNNLAQFGVPIPLGLTGVGITVEAVVEDSTIVPNGFNLTTNFLKYFPL